MKWVYDSFIHSFIHSFQKTFFCFYSSFSCTEHQKAEVQLPCVPASPVACVQALYFSVTLLSHQSSVVILLCTGSSSCKSSLLLSPLDPDSSVSPILSPLHRLRIPLLISSLYLHLAPSTKPSTSLAVSGLAGLPRQCWSAFPLC